MNFAHVAKRVIVEPFAVFRQRTEFPDDVFYISDFVTKEGVRLAESPSLLIGRRAEQVRSLVASSIKQEVCRLKNGSKVVLKPLFFFFSGAD